MFSINTQTAENTHVIWKYFPLMFEKTDQKISDPILKCIILQLK